jgi:uncharacterized membrane-anchored protein YhcB (DUF1043 family)
MWNYIWKIVLTLLVSIGGIGAVFTAVVKFSSGIIAERLSKKYEIKLNKEFEKYKTTLENKNYISKAKFDTEFSIYRDLSIAYSEMTKHISILIPVGISSVPVEENAKKEYDKEIYKNALESLVKAQDILYGNIPFIPEEFAEGYTDILGLCNIQLKMFERRWNVGFCGTYQEKCCFCSEEYQRTQDIQEKLKVLNKHIRNYLSKLDVLE